MTQEEADRYIKINRTSMEFIWKKVSKIQKNEKDYIRYLPDDIPFLYQSGMIDIVRIPFDEFKAFFDPLRGTDGAFYLDHDTFLQMGQFRYYKIVGKPFDPLQMRKGKYSIERLKRVFETSYLPSTSLNPNFIWDLFHNKICKDVDADGMVNVDEEMLKNLSRSLEQHPSPRRKLELDVAALQDTQIQELTQFNKPSEESTFTDKKDIKKSAIKGLDNLLVKSTESVEDPNRKGTGEILDLKKLKKPRSTKA